MFTMAKWLLLKTLLWLLLKEVACTIWLSMRLIRLITQSSLTITTPSLLSLYQLQLQVSQTMMSSPHSYFSSYVAAHHSDYCSPYFHVETSLCVAFPVVSNKDDVIGVAGCISEMMITVIVVSGKDIAIQFGVLLLTWVCGIPEMSEWLEQPEMQKLGA